MYTHATHKQGLDTFMKCLTMYMYMVIQQTKELIHCSRQMYFNTIAILMCIYILFKS